MTAVADVVLSSTRNPRVRAAAALRDRRARDEAGLTLIDGVRELARAIAGGARDRRGLRRPGAARTDRALAAVEAARAAGAGVVDGQRASSSTRLAYGDRGDGIVAVARIPDPSLDRAVTARGRPRRRRRGRREAGQPRRGAAIGGRRGRRTP